MPGMILAKDIMDFSGQILIAQDTVLTDRLISKLQFYHITNLKVYIDENSKPVHTSHSETLKVIPMGLETNLSKIKKTKDYQNFRDDFYRHVERFQTYVNKVFTGDEPLEVESLLSSTYEVLANSRNVIHLFDMLNCMHEYDDSTYSHCVNVSLICHIFGKWIHLTKSENEILTLCGLFHDIGKLEIPQSIIMKPAKLTDDEYNTIKTHTVIGYEMLKNKKIDQRIKNCALMHHERIDGSGYPQKLKDNKIDNFAKIVSIADVYDALTSKRVYRDPLCPFEVLSIFGKEGFTKYDPKYLVIFFEQMFQTYLTNTVRLSNGKEGKIIMINKHDLSSPVIQIGDEFIDLSKDKSLYIQAII